MQRAFWLLRGGTVGCRVDAGIRTGRLAEAQVRWPKQGAVTAGELQVSWVLAASPICERHVQEVLAMLGAVPGPSSKTLARMNPALLLTRSLPLCSPGLSCLHSLRPSDVTGRQASRLSPKPGREVPVNQGFLIEPLLRAGSRGRIRER